MPVMRVLRDYRHDHRTCHRALHAILVLLPAQKQCDPRLRGQSISCFALMGAHLKTARTVRGAAWNMVFWEERALAATVPRSPSLSYSAFTFCMDLPVAWLRACKGRHCYYMILRHTV